MNTLNQNKSKKFATGWLIVVACMLIQAIPFGVASNIQPQFVSYVVEEKGFTLAGFSLIFTLGTIVSAVASPFIGMMFNKISAKTMYLLGAILSGGGFLAFSMCQELWQFYIVAGIVQVGTSIISSMAFIQSLSPVLAFSKIYFPSIFSGSIFFIDATFFTKALLEPNSWNVEPIIFIYPTSPPLPNAPW